MGIWALFLTIITIFEMTKTNLLKNAHIKFVSSSPESDEKTIIASSSLIINLSITLVFILLILLFSSEMNSWAHIGIELGHMLMWYIPGLMFMMFFSHLEAIQQSHLDFKGVFAGYFVRQVLFFGFIITHKILSIPFTLTHLVMYQTISIFVGAATMFFFTRP
jgi:lipopolysaccharide exporter